MKYRLNWLEYWSTKMKSLDNKVVTLFNEESDGWFEHERVLYFTKDTDTQAIVFVKDYLKTTQDDIGVFSLSDINEVIFTEEEI